MKCLRNERAFTLTELLVTLAIIAILSAMMLGGLSQAGRSRKSDVTKFAVQKLSSAIMEVYEDFEDESQHLPNLIAVRQRLRGMFPDSWEEVAPGSVLVVPTSAIERNYRNYKLSGGLPTPAYQGAECLYMIVTQSGRFPDLLAEIRPEQVGDVDGDGKKEFLDAWGNPIAFLRWAPGYVAPLTGLPTIQVADAVNRHDPFDRLYAPLAPLPPPSSDATAYALFPLIYSAGPDEAGNANSPGPSGYGLIRAENGWRDGVFPNGDLIPLCGFNPDGKGLVGAPDPDNPSAHLDNITNFDLMLK